MVWWKKFFEIFQKVMVVELFILGCAALILLLVYLMSAFVYAFDPKVDYPGDIAFVPKWIFFLSLFVLLKDRKEVKEFFEVLEKYLH